MFNLNLSDSVNGQLPSGLKHLSSVANVNALNTKLHELYCGHMTIEAANMAVRCHQPKAG